MLPVLIICRHDLSIACVVPDCTCVARHVGLMNTWLRRIVIILLAEMARSRAHRLRHAVATERGWLVSQSLRLRLYHSLTVVLVVGRRLLRSVTTQHSLLATLSLVLRLAVQLTTWIMSLRGAHRKLGGRLLTLLRHHHLMLV